MSLVNRVAKALRGAGVGAGERLAVAVSGGVDSMVLLDAVARLRTSLGVRLHVVHVHHGLRGKAADLDAALVVAEAARLGVSVTVARANPADRRRGESVQTWARRVRYAHLQAVQEQVRASRILVAHTLNDQAETLLLNLLRGTGPRGLAGIPPSRGPVLRPLLQVPRVQVEAYASARRVPFRPDASNASDAYRRNRIRRHLLPLLEQEYNPRIVESLGGLAALVREDEAAFEAVVGPLAASAIRSAGASVFLDAAALQGSPPAVARRVIQQAFRQEGQGAHTLTRRHLEALLRLPARGGALRLPGGRVAECAGRVIRIGPASEASPGQALRASEASRLGTPEIPVRVGVWARWDPLNCRVRVQRLPAEAVAGIRRDQWRQVFDSKLIADPLRLRSWRPGDRFDPLGGPGRKKLQDFFVDARVPRRQRAAIPLLLSGERIAWVMGRRVSEAFRWRGRGGGCLVEVEFSASPHQSKPDN
jgi:tRNA(Ile)-lysidine synthase